MSDCLNIEKVFLVFNTACFGDVLICNSLCRNIKRIYPKSKLVFIVDKPFYDVAKFQDCVDEVFVYDKKGVHKGFKGFLKFVKEFPYKKPFASFVAYRNTRNVWVSRLIGAKNIFESEKFVMDKSAQVQVLSLLENLTEEKIENLPLVYNAPEVALVEGDYVVLCTTSKRETKDMPIETAITLINKINRETGLKIVFTGAGQKSVDYAEKLLTSGCDFINMVNKTTIPELSSLIKKSKALISVDTGTMHLGYAVSTPLVAIFYEENMSKCWSPDTDLYNAVLIEKNQSAENIFNEIIRIINS